MHELVNIPLLGETPAVRLAMLSMRNAIYMFGKSIPDGERFPQVYP